MDGKSEDAEGAKGLQMPQRKRIYFKVTIIPNTVFQLHVIPLERDSNFFVSSRLSQGGNKRTSLC